MLLNIPHLRELMEKTMRLPWSLEHEDGFDLIDNADGLLVTFNGGHAKFLVEFANAAPELLRLAEIGQRVEGGK